MERLQEIAQAIERVENQNHRFQQLATAVFIWGSHARRPLTIPELQDAVSIKPGMAGLDSGCLPEVRFLNSICGGLITVNKENLELSLGHRVKEWFATVQPIWWTNAQAAIATACVTYLLFSVFETGPSSTDGEFEERLRRYPFYQYAAKNWGYHARAAQMKMDETMMEFLQNQSKVSASVQALVAAQTFRSATSFSQQVPKKVTGLHLAAHFGLEEELVFFLVNGYDPDSSDGYGRTPLSWAAENGNRNVAVLLLQRYSANPNSRDKEGMTPLSWSMMNGHAETTRAFFSHRASFYLEERYIATALRAVAEDGYADDMKDTYESDIISGLGKPQNPMTLREVKSVIQGTWSGNYYYSYNGSIRDGPVSFNLRGKDDESAEERLFIEADGEDDPGSFIIYGYATKSCEILFAKIYSAYGWIYCGRLDIDRKIIVGWWGLHDQDIKGTFVFRKEPGETCSLLQPSSCEGIGDQGPVNSAPKDDSRVGLDQPLRYASTSLQESNLRQADMLCDECTGINFPKIGYHEKDETNRLRVFRKLSISKLSKSATSCGFCRHVLEVFHSKAARISDKNITQNMDSEKSMVTISNNDFFNHTNQSSLCYISVYVKIEAKTCQDQLAVLFSFQKGTSESMTVQELCDRFSILSWPQLEHGIARWRSLVADLRLFQKWNEFCNRVHQHHSYIPPSRQSKLQRIRLIDVQHKCLIEEFLDPNSGKWGVSWVVLSYVWGSTNFTRLTNASLKNFQTHGFFRPGSVPDTIMDAITVVGAIGERYLWVDSCCIVQDSEDDKEEFISRMDIVYGLASLTIVNAAGDHANYGLPGVRAGTRKNSQTSFQLKGLGISVIEMLDPGECGTRGIDSYLHGTTWDSRGWTLQEGILSQKLLIFTSEKVYWECQNATWCEDSHWETSIEPSENRIYHRIPFTINCMDPRELWDTKIESFYKAYRHIIQVYSMRQLSYEGDFLNAFLGVSYCLEYTSGTKFYWGTPTKYMAGGLCWYRPGYLDEKWKTRVGKCRIKLSQRVCQVEFPSWSWVSCVGGHLYNPNENLNGLDGCIVFHILNKDGVVEKLARHMEPGANRPLTYDTSYSSWRGPTYSVVTKDVPQAIIQSDVAPALLLFYTSSVTLDAISISGSGPALLHNGRNIEVSWGQEPVLNTRRSQLKLIIIGENTLAGQKAGKVSVWALAVKEVEYGVLKRIGLLSMWEQEWNSINEKEWKLVFLA